MSDKPNATLRERLLKAYSSRSHNSYAVIDAPDLYEIIGMLQDGTVSETRAPLRSESGESFLGENDYRELLVEILCRSDAKLPADLRAGIDKMLDGIKCVPSAGGRIEFCPVERCDCKIGETCKEWEGRGTASSEGVASAPTADESRDAFIARGYWPNEVLWKVWEQACEWRGAWRPRS